MNKTTIDNLLQEVAELVGITDNDVYAWLGFDDNGAGVVIPNPNHTGLESMLKLSRYLLTSTLIDAYNINGWGGVNRMLDMLISDVNYDVKNAITQSKEYD